MLFAHMLNMGSRGDGKLYILPTRLMNTPWLS